MNAIIEIIAGFALLDTSLDILAKLLAGGALTIIVWQVDVALLGLSSILVRWSVVGSGGHCCSSVVMWSSSWYWCCGCFGDPRSVGRDPGVAQLPFFYCLDDIK